MGQWERNERIYRDEQVRIKAREDYKNLKQPISEGGAIFVGIVFVALIVYSLLESHPKIAYSIIFVIALFIVVLVSRIISRVLSNVRIKQQKRNEEEAREYNRKFSEEADMTERAARENEDMQRKMQEQERIQRQIEEDKKRISNARDKIVNRTGKKKILIVDDQVGIRVLLHEVFSAEGYNTMQAENGAEALNIVKKSKQNPDVIFLDLKLPDISGVEVLRGYCELGADIPTFLITAYGENEVIQECIELGALKVYMKPFNVGEMLSDLKYLLETEIV